MLRITLQVIGLVVLLLAATIVTLILLGTWLEARMRQVLEMVTIDAACGRS